jgi:hypothetical protein
VRMSFTWRYEDSDGGVLPTPQGVPGADDGYGTQADAETWLGENWRVLLDAGVEQVTLVEDAAEAYGPMPLRPPE